MDGQWRWDRLSPVEKQIAELLLLGKTNKEIGAEVFLSRARVQEYVKRIVAKTEAETTRSAIKLLVEEREIRLFMAVLDDVPMGVAILQDGVCKYANRAMAEISGYDFAELVGKSIPSAFPAEDREWALRQYERRVRGVPLVSPYRFKIVSKNGELREIETVSAGVILLGGRPADLVIARTPTEEAQE